MLIREVAPADRGEWLRMRKALWPECPEEQHLTEMATMLDKGQLLTGELDWVIFVAEREDSSAGADKRLGGFLEASIHPEEENCETTPVGFVEGWFVDEDLRQQGVGGALVRAAEEWARRQGCREMASDTDDFRQVSQKAHQALGYRVTSSGEEIKFQKWL